MKRYFVCALEHSGDIAGAELCSEIQSLMICEDQNTEFYGIGGSAMENFGVKLIANTVNNSIMGFTGVIFSVKHMLDLMHKIAQFVKAENFDAVIFIDAPDFNFRLAKLLQSVRSQTKLVYFILPQIWAWRQERFRLIKNLFDLKLSVFPFEKEWFKSKNLNVDYIGNPTAQRVRNFLRNRKFADSRKLFDLPAEKSPRHPVIAMLPGSRKGEIANLLEVQINTLNKIHENFPQLIGILTVAKDKNIDLYQSAIKSATFEIKLAIQDESKCFADTAKLSNVKTFNASSLEVLQACDAGIVCSGTATLEAALMNLPSVVTYKSGWLNYFIVKIFVKVKLISIANIILGKEVLPEFIQKNCKPELIAQTLTNMLSKSARQNFSEYNKKLWAKIGDNNPFADGADLINKNQ